MSRYKQIRFSLAILILGSSLILGDGLPVYGQGVDGYQGQSNEQMTTGQWGGEVGADSHGPDRLFFFSSEEHDRYAVDLIRFELAGKLPKEATVTRAVLLLHAEKEGSGNHASAYKVLQQWVDDPASNHGVLLKAHDGGANFHWWADGDKGDHPPRIIIEYNVQ